ncbi:histidine kinase dimerization/phospho-acceptor domain-containing protein [Lentilactobacillus buchneri]|nr:histidine kinase dimerization/phospho-acceptor domain-containing protein [Lentilactobacillus buchneri]MDS1014399.1 histidine kinase dimerization/phospho-acceptor domain-containing protein [Lentilactobacillus buchneri]
MLQGISHDLRTPLTIISGSADILKREGNKLSDVAKYTLYDQYLMTLHG